LNCPSCGHENAADAAFCNKCGARLEIVCAHCQRSNRGDSTFCAGCGQKLTAGATTAAPPAPISYTPKHLAEKILRDRAALEGERRTVTVLFSDAMGFTPLSEKIDAEEVYGLMQGCLGRMMDAVHRYEGTITQFTGDGIMALFGAPIAHEDAARRAIAAALEMQTSLADYANEVHKRHPIECRFRVGLNTGPVVVGKISDNLDMDYTALGDTVNLASRMEELADPGTVYLTEDTHRQAGDYFECEALGALMVKGKSAPVVAYRAVREKAAVRTRLQAQAERGLTPFVGRTQELSVLKGYFEQAKRGRGQVVFITGEAGLGKSRLLHEFRRSVLDEPLVWLEGHCISFGKRISYLPIADIIKRDFGIEEGDHDDQIAAKVDAGTEGWDEPTRKTVPYLKYLLNVDPGDEAVATMDPMERRAGILDALRALLIQESRGRPLVVLIEDLHWVDEKSEEAIAAMVDVVQSTPTLMVLTYRPGYSHSLGERTYFSRLALSHLPAEESAAIAERVLNVATLPEQIRTLITSKGEGNPFYVEEVAKTLVESGVLRPSNGSYALERPVEQVVVPDTIQEVILSRIDRLEQEAKEAIQLASVIGREFTARLLNRISDVEAELDDLLGELKTLELIYEKAYFPELSYMFKHALTHDVAYSTLLMARRKGLHRLVGAAIEELYADRLPEQYEALAHHYSEAQDWEKALEYLEKAGDKAVAAFANQDALDYYARALEAADRLGGEAVAVTPSICERSGFVRFGMGDFTGAAVDFAEMRKRAAVRGDRRTEVMAMTLRGNADFEAHDFETAERVLQEALNLAGNDVPEASFLVNSTLLFLNAVLNRREEMAHYAARADDLMSEVTDPFARWQFEFLKGMAPHWMGHYEPALEVNLASRHFAEESHVAVAVVWHLWEESLMRGARGEYTRALRILEELLTFSDRIGDTSGKARVLNTIGWIHGELQNHAEAMTWNQKSIEAAQDIKAYSKIEIEANARLNLADSLMALGRADEAEEHFQWVEKVVRNPRPPELWMLWRYAQHLFHSYGELWLQRGDAEKALSYADECLELAEKSESRKIIVKARRLRGQALMALRQVKQPERDIDSAIQLAQEVGNPPQLWKTYVALGDLRKAQRREKEAREAYGEALAVIKRVAEGLEDEKLRETFLSSRHVRGIREKAGEETSSAG
jgi:class 3 adenylate cyclase/tetratricopeptide (TPR) repeat protein